MCPPYGVGSGGERGLPIRGQPRDLEDTVIINLAWMEERCSKPFRGNERRQGKQRKKTPIEVFQAGLEIGLSGEMTNTTLQVSLAKCDFIF